MAKNWDDAKPKIRTYYMDEKKPLEEVRRLMKEIHRFEASSVFNPSCQPRQPSATRDAKHLLQGSSVQDQDHRMALSKKQSASNPRRSIYHG